MISTLNWFLKRIAVVWLILTIAVVASVLHSIHQSAVFR